MRVVRRHTIPFLMALSLLAASFPAPAVAASRYNWVPRTGTGFAYNNWNGTTYRRVAQYFSWSTASQLSALQGSNVTLEVETHIHCVSGACWIDTPRYPPYKGVAWDTNMPNGYLDTQFGDDPNLPNVTVGSSDTRGMVAGTLYWTWVIAYPESPSSGTGSTWFQIGHRDPSWCGSTWCIYADDTVATVPNWQFPLPGTKSWSWP